MSLLLFVCLFVCFLNKVLIIPKLLEARCFYIIWWGLKCSSKMFARPQIKAFKTGFHPTNLLCLVTDCDRFTSWWWKQFWCVHVCVMSLLLHVVTRLQTQESIMPAGRLISNLAMFTAAWKPARRWLSHTEESQSRLSRLCSSMKRFLPKLLLFSLVPTIYFLAISCLSAWNN